MINERYPDLNILNQVDFICFSDDIFGVFEIAKSFIFKEFLERLSAELNTILKSLNDRISHIFMPSIIMNSLSKGLDALIKKR
jgi:hypothetical protein